MQKEKQHRTFVADFESTVYEGQEYTEVWAAALVEIGSEDVHIFHSIDEWYGYVKSIPGDLRIYFHNLKFDGPFIVTYLIHNGYEQALNYDDTGHPISFTAPKNLRYKQFIYSISARMGMWYSITVHEGRRLIEIRDSLKLLPVSVKRLGESFGTKHKKSSIEYTGFRYAGCPISKEEKGYIANDVLVVKEALEIIFAEGHTSLTIGSCCYKEYEKKFNIFFGANYHKHGDKSAFHEAFPNVYETELDKDTYGSSNAGEYIRKSYKGGWCYVVPGKAEHVLTNGSTFDVNSLYPSMMHSESGNFYPVGEPHFWHGNYIPDEVYDRNRVFFIRVRTEFYLKRGYLPCIQIKRSLVYKATEWLTTCISDYHKRFPKEPKSVELTLTSADFDLICEHYDLPGFEILDGCWFDTETGLFDCYIDHYRDIKLKAKGAKREIAKLFLNNLYGKMATNTDSSFKVAHLDDEDVLKFLTVTADDKRPGYIPCGSFITSYARNFTIRAAQANYHGPHAKGFVYADTDSIHCDCAPDKVGGITLDPVKFCCWKNETSWDTGWFVRPKRYLERVVIADGKPMDNPYWSIRCAGMPERCKVLFSCSLEGKTKPSGDTESEAQFFAGLTEEEREFISVKRDITDFREGLSVPGKLAAHQIPGGTVLEEVPFVMHES